MFRSLLLGFTLSLVCVCASAQAVPTVGEKPADFTPVDWINPPTWQSLDELKGDVVIIKAWGLDAKKSVEQLATDQKFHEMPGIHVVSLYAQVHPLDEVQAVVDENKVTFPIAAEGWLADYAAPQLPQTWVVGIDGSVVWEGIGEYSAAAEKEIAKVKYPGLGRNSFLPELEPAAKAFGQGNYAEAYKLAEAVYDDAETDKLEEDAEYITERIEDRLSELEVRAETAEVIKDYRLAMACWAEIASKYEGLEDAEEAPERLKQLQENEDVKKEVAAKKELLRLIMKLDVDFQDVDEEDIAAVTEYRRDCLAAYREFAKANPDTGAGDKAEELIEVFKQLVGEE